MPRPTSALATLINREQQDNPEFKLWGTVIEIAWYDATIRNDARAKEFFFQRDSVFEDISTMWALPIDAIRERLKKVIAEKQIQKHIDRRRYRRANAKKEPVTLPAPAPSTTPQPQWRTTWN